jgi:hypothetical protein
MGRQKRNGNHSPPPSKKINTGIQREMKKTDTQFQTSTKQRYTMPRNPTKPTKTS